MLFSALTERFAVSAELRTALTVGLLGAYTTFSTFALETVRLSDDSALAIALLNIVASVVAGIIAVRFGIALGRML